MFWGSRWKDVLENTDGHKWMMHHIRLIIVVLLVFVARHVSNRCSAKPDYPTESRCFRLFWGFTFDSVISLTDKSAAQLLQAWYSITNKNSTRKHQFVGSFFHLQTFQPMPSFLRTERNRNVPFIWKMPMYQKLLCCLFFSCLDGQLQINLYRTNWVTDQIDEDHNGFQHHCLYVSAFSWAARDPHQIISYCLGEGSHQWKIQGNTFGQRLTFAQLSERHVTSEQLYLWSAPIDVAEDYQQYLNLGGTSTSSNQSFYN